jgi:hypothetical protein
VDGDRVDRRRLVLSRCPQGLGHSVQV